MFEDERQRVSHRRGAIARGVAKRGLVAFLAFAMAFSTTPAQLWAEGAEGIAEAVAQAATPGEDAALAGGTAEQSGAEVSDSEGAPAASAAIAEAATGGEGSATGRALPRASSLRRGIRWPSGICRRGCRSGREPDRNRRCRQEAGRGLVLDYRHRC